MAEKSKINAILTIQSCVIIQNKHHSNQWGECAPQNSLLELCSATDRLGQLITQITKYSGTTSWTHAWVHSWIEQTRKQKTWLRKSWTRLRVLLSDAPASPTSQVLGMKMVLLLSLTLAMALYPRCQLLVILRIILLYSELTSWVSFTSDLSNLGTSVLQLCRVRPGGCRLGWLGSLSLLQP